MSIWLLYLISIMGKTSTLFSIVTVLAGIASAMSSVAVAVLHDEREKDERKVACKIRNVAIVVLIAALPLGFLMPSKRDAYIMVGAYVATNTAGVEKLPPNVVKALNKFLEDYIGEEK